MKKLCNGKGRRIHPTPQQPAAGAAAWEQLAALPAALLALAAALTPQEQEVLAYLLIGGGGAPAPAPAAAGRRWREQRQRRPHPPELGCGCFGCYKSFWERWDASPNRHVIHRVIDAVEEGLELGERAPGGRGRRRRRSGKKGGTLATPEEESAAELVAAEQGEKESFAAEKKLLPELDAGHVADDDDGSDEVDSQEGDGEEITNSNAKSSVRRFVSFIGERVWGAWN